jgi:hypothetical protein
MRGRGVDCGDRAGYLVPDVNTRALASRNTLALRCLGVEATCGMDEPETRYSTITSDSGALPCSGPLHNESRPADPSLDILSSFLPLGLPKYPFPHHPRSWSLTDGRKTSSSSGRTWERHVRIGPFENITDFTSLISTAPSAQSRPVVE